jgi:hypothetical protein
MLSRNVNDATFFGVAFTRLFQLEKNVRQWRNYSQEVFEWQKAE